MINIQDDPESWEIRKSTMERVMVHVFGTTRPALVASPPGPAPHDTMSTGLARVREGKFISARNRPRIVVSPAAFREMGLQMTIREYLGGVG